jgi:transposase
LPRLDIDQARVLFATEGRDAQTIAAFADDLAAHGGDPEAIGEVCIWAFRQVHLP